MHVPYIVPGRSLFIPHASLAAHMVADMQEDIVEGQCIAFGSMTATFAMLVVQA